MTPNTSGKNFSAFLPKVGAGTPISYDHINKLSEAVARNKLNSVGNGLVKSSNNGLAIEPIVSDAQSHPWQVSVEGSEVVIRVGGAFGSYQSSVEIQKFIAPYEQAEKTQVPFPNVTCDITGHEFSEQAPWFLKFPVGSITEPKVVFVRAEYSPVVSYANLSGFAPDFYVVPIAVITPEYFVIQLVSGDIWMKGVNKPFQVYLYSETTGSQVKHYAKVSAGTVNGMIPKYQGGDFISIPTAKLEFNPSQTVYFYLKMDGSPEPALFPTAATIIASTTMLVDTVSTGYVLLAMAQFDMSKTPPTVTVLSNFLSGSIRAEAHRYSPTKVNYFFYYY